ncbi:MAG: hypothetical protein K0S41_1319 [Anaerocolumna sp.]|nr:hypothetical protein [Anaerocolumna sp.]
MMNNKYQLPKPIETHFYATNTDDSTSFLSVFTENADVFDAGKVYHGKDAIKEWSDREYFGVRLRLEVINAIHNAKEFVVTAKTDGNYDKTGLPDPLYIDFHFTLDGDKITLLRNVLSSNSRAIPLPETIATFFHAQDVYDDDLLASCFADNAILLDEGQEYYGPENVSGHILEANRNAKVRTEISNCVELSDKTIIVTATISGDFVGSPISLYFNFTINNGKIKTLNIEVADV